MSNELLPYAIYIKSDKNREHYLLVSKVTFRLIFLSPYSSIQLHGDTPHAIHHDAENDDVGICRNALDGISGVRGAVTKDYR